MPTTVCSSRSSTRPRRARRRSAPRRGRSLGSDGPRAHDAENAAFARWVAKDNASARDARVALLEAAGRPAGDDRPPTTRVDLPPRAVALALGAEARVRVTMATSERRRLVRRANARRRRADHGGARARARAVGLLQRVRVAPRRAGFRDPGAEPRGQRVRRGYTRYFRDELGTVPHARGTVGMSTRGHDTGDGQWFVNLRDNLRLGRDYTVFGEVVEGMDVVDGDPRRRRNRPDRGNPVASMAKHPRTSRERYRGFRRGLSPPSTRRTNGGCGSEARVRR